jgi:cellulose synthase/poly-beta-1,6-N-acetylglucosamine synthase-like glycosyltransferase
MMKTRNKISLILYVVFILLLSFLIIGVPLLQTRFFISLIAFGAIGFGLITLTKKNIKGYIFRRSFATAFLFGIFLGIIATYLTPISITLLLLFAGLFALIPIMFISILSFFNGLKYRNYDLDESYRPRFSVIVPAHNEERYIARTIEKFLAVDYPKDKKELIVVNDSSTDSTQQIISKYAYRIIQSDTGKIKYNVGGNRNVTLVNRPSGGNGKAFASNDGKKYAAGDIFFFIDADVQIDKRAMKIAAKYFSNKNIGAVTGRVLVNNISGNSLNNFVGFETGAARIARKGFDTLFGIHYIIPGGCAIFRREIFDKVGDYEADTLAEDTDMAWRVMVIAKKETVFDENILVTADEPGGIWATWAQRTRWARGNYGITKKYRKFMFKKEYGKATTIGMPFWFANILIPLAFIPTTLGLLFEAMFGLNMPFVLALSRLMAFSFIFIWLLGIYANKGKEWFSGLISPGFAILFTLIVSLIFPTGMLGFLTMIGLQSRVTIISLFISVWILLTIPASFLIAQIAKRNHDRIAQFAQLYLFGYWGLTVASTINGYVKEFRKEKPVWIHKGDIEK